MLRGRRSSESARSSPHCRSQTILQIGLGQTQCTKMDWPCIGKIHLSVPLGLGLAALAPGLVLGLEVLALVLEVLGEIGMTNFVLPIRRCNPRSTTCCLQKHRSPERPRRRHCHNRHPCNGKSFPCHRRGPKWSHRRTQQPAEKRHLATARPQGIHRWMFVWSKTPGRESPGCPHWRSQIRRARPGQNQCTWMDLPGTGTYH